MIISPEKKLIFLQVAKCGSFSLEGWSKRYLQNPIVANQSHKFNQHNLIFEERHADMTALNKNRNPIFDLNDWAIFAICRNPYDRLVSAFHHCQEVFKNWLTISFENFILQQKFKCSRMHFLPQMCWWHPELQWMHLENIDEEFVKVQKHTGIYEPLKKHNKTKSRKADWEKYYTQEMKDVACEFYKRDFEELGYDK